MDKKEYKDLTMTPRRWFPLYHLDYYILREFLIKYSVLLLVFVILFILSDVYRDVGDFLEAKVGLRETVAYLAYKLPGNIRFILPISMLLGCMWTMATFGKNMEVTAMRASGVSLFRCSGSILAVGLLVTFVNIYFNEALVPYTERQAEELFERAVKKRNYVQNILAFRSSDQKRQWLFEVFANGDAQKNVALKSFWTAGMIDQLVLSQRGDDYQKMVRDIFGRNAVKLLALPDAAEREYVKKELLDRKVDLTAAQARYDRDRKLWIFEDVTFVSYDKNDDTSFAASSGISTFHDKIAVKTLTFDENEIPETPSDIINIIKEKDDLPTWVIFDLVRRTPNMADRVYSIYMTVFYYRLAFPWACFLAVFLGIPLATKNERTGSLMAIITAVVIIVVYIVLAQVFLVLGKSGVLNPAFAGLAPTVGFIICGAYKILFDRN